MAASVDVREKQLNVPSVATKAVFKKTGGPIEFVQYNPDAIQLKEGEVLVRITYSGVCHTCVCPPFRRALCF